MALAVGWLGSAAVMCWWHLRSASATTTAQWALELAGWAGLAAAHFALARRGTPGASQATWPGALLLAAYTVDVMELPARPVAILVGVVALVALGRPLGGRHWPVPLLMALATVVPRAVHIKASVGGSAAPLLADELRPPRPLPVATSDLPPLVIVSVDTLRVDAANGMKAYRWLGQRGRVFDDAWSTASWTLPSFTSAFTGLTPYEHGAGFVNHRWTRLADDLPLLSEALHERGYVTGAFVDNVFLQGWMGFDRGFDVFEHAREHPQYPLPLTGSRAIRGDDVIVDGALRFLERQPARGWAVWVHLFDPHLPYEHAPADDPARATDDADETVIQDWKPEPALREAVRRAYLNEVAFTDTQLERLFAHLDARGFFEAGGLVVFFSDHGEQFWEHGGFEHGRAHVPEVVQVPLAVAGAGIPAGTIAEPVSLADIHETTLAWADGRASGLAGARFEDRVVTSSGALWGPGYTSARDDSNAAMVKWEGGAPAEEARFDRTSDPEELHPLGPLPEGEVDPVLTAARDTKLPTEMRGSEADIDQRALEALGYVAPD